tara:strand:- start:569 stop:1327 length:759 start_codon:yes stop_codon:yes gene_type:complete
MNRNLVCLLRLLVDSLPKKIRDSQLLFLFARIIFKLPKSLYNFRDDYKKGRIKNLAKYYSINSTFDLPQSSYDTDTNSFHLNLIKRYVIQTRPKSLLDVGCGTGHLIQYLNHNSFDSRLVGIDFNIPKFSQSTSISRNNNTINYVQADVVEYISSILSNSFDLVICAHFLEHVEDPKAIINEIRRISRRSLILICPLEKPFRWGFNYHLHFFQDNQSFIEMVLSEKTNHNNYITHQRLGDSMYIEHTPFPIN